MNNNDDKTAIASYNSNNSFTKNVKIYVFPGKNLDKQIATQLRSKGIAKGNLSRFTVIYLPKRNTMHKRSYSRNITRKSRRRSHSIHKRQ